MVVNIAFLLALLVQDIGKLSRDPSILQIHILEGDGAAYPAGSRATRGVTIQVTDETGKPVEGASVNFQLPQEGPGGTFASGSRTEAAVTHADGKASAWGMQWNRTEGSFEIRITASKGQTRAGILCPQSLSAPISTHDSSRGFSKSHKWVWITLAVAGAAGAAAAASGMSSKSSTPVGPTSTPLSIGAPTIVIGHP